MYGPRSDRSCTAAIRHRPGWGWGLFGVRRTAARHRPPPRRHHVSWRRLDDLRSTGDIDRRQHLVDRRSEPRGLAAALIGKEKLMADEKTPVLAEAAKQEKIL